MTLRTTTENYSFQTKTGTLIEHGYTHEELHAFLKTELKGNSGWIEVIHSFGARQNIHYKVIADGQPRFTDGKFNDADVAFCRRVFGEAAANLLLTDHL